MNTVNNLNQLAILIQKANNYFLNKAQKQVNTALTLRNWLVGYYIVEYEQRGTDRATYGANTLNALARQLKQKSLKGMAETNLKLYRQFYLTYPEIRQALSDELQNVDFKELGFSQAVPDLLKPVSLVPKPDLQPSKDLWQTLNYISFSHFIELIKAENAPKRRFYEDVAIRNNWGTRELKRAMDSLLYERTGLSRNKEVVKADFERNLVPEPEAVFKNTYLLEFLGLEEKAGYSESDLEERIISNLQKFLIELGRGFCFEHRQKRITFDNTHYRIDLVFYHRILKCHVLLDLKIGEFDHADAGQMNMYLNYYKENESHNGDNPPVGIILCSGKNEALVKYATMGLPQQVFVSKYLMNLPSEEELMRIVEEEKEK
jgi:predicted nuclease of restriction endonuclease-like (RecB) superfamily